MKNLNASLLNILTILYFHIRLLQTKQMIKQRVYGEKQHIPHSVAKSKEFIISQFSLLFIRVWEYHVQLRLVKPCLCGGEHVARPAGVKPQPDLVTLVGYVPGCVQGGPRLQKIVFLMFFWTTLQCIPRQVGHIFCWQYNIPSSCSDY